MPQGHGPPPPQPPRSDPASNDYDSNGYGVPRARWLTVTDAMEYLDAVKLEFRNQPEIYDEFLAIMGRFKTKQMLPPDVIEEVARLFRGRNSLVLRFNRFLPDGYKIAESDIERMEQDSIAREQAAALASRAGAGGPLGVDIRNRGVKGEALHGVGPDGDRSVRSGEDGEAEGEEEEEEEDEDTDMEGEEGDPDDPERSYEFDHAIHYVTTIKRRFCADPGTYKAFLDILHTYQRERKGISEVLEQVTDLFADEPDLLREFTYFLPDGVQAQAKERLDHAAVEAEIRLGTRDQNGQLLQRSWKHGSFQRGRGGRKSISSRDQAGGRRQRLQHREGPRGNYPDMDQEWWRNQRGYGRFGNGHRGGSQGSRSQYANGGDTDRRGPRQQQQQQQQQQALYSGNSHQHTARHTRKGRQVWCHAEDYELGPDGLFKGPKKRARAPDTVHGPIVEVRGWTSADSQGGTIKSSDEQQFFDQARQALSSGGDANDWNEFMKCLSLFTTRTLGRTEFLNMVTDLFEAHNEFELVEEFKALVCMREDSELLHRNGKPILGLSEIDFENKRKCSPSYRELSEEHHFNPCSGRSAEEEAVLNDMWVSVPVGSEDSNTFKHMRRNPHEEALYKTEDERFELDMLIDGVAAAIARLEPVEEEVEVLRATTASALVTDSAGATGVGGGTGGDVPLPHVEYHLDRRTLGALHLSTISRLYGDHGAEVLELLRKNPAVAIPVVLKRLRQKEREWRRAREAAKPTWKDLAQKNFHRSLDHRSHHFRREDKRLTSIRALLQEIKDKKVEEDPLKAAVVKAAREKVQDAHADALVLGRTSPSSTAMDVDSASVGQGSTGEADAAALASDASGESQEASPGSLREPRSKEGIRLMRQHAEESSPWYMFAHLTLAYPEEETASIHKDIMELLSHTLARRPPPDDDVRQASTVLANLLPTFFALSKPPTATSNGASSRGESGRDDGAPDGRGGLPQQAAPSMPVLSSSDDDSDRENGESSGDDRIVRQVSNLSSGTADGQAGGNRTRSPVGDAGKGSGEEGRMASSHRLINQEVFFTTTDFYLVLRMHHLLAERLAVAKRLCRDARFSRQTVLASSHEALRASAGVAPKDGAPTLMGTCTEQIAYKIFLGHLHDLVEEKITSDRYDEGVRQLVGNQGYVLCSLDKLVVSLLQNLYRSSGDRVFRKLAELYHYERDASGGRVSPSIYRHHAQQLLRRSDKQVVRVQYHPGVKGLAGGAQVKPTLKMEYIGRLDTESGGQGGAGGSDGHGGRAVDRIADDDASVAMDEG